MIKKELITYSLKNIYKRKTRSFLTVLSIFVGITSIFIFISFGFGLYNYINSFTTSTSVDKILIMPKGISAPGIDDNFAITENDVEAIEKTPGVFSATGLYAKAVQIEQNKITKYVFLISFDPKKPLILEMSSIKIDDGRELQEGDDGKAVLGYNYKVENKIFPKAYQVGDNIIINGQKTRIIGFLGTIGNPADDSQIYITNDYFKKLYPNETGYAEVIARVDIKDMNNIINRVEKNLRNSRGLDKGQEDFFVSSFDDLIEQYSSALDIVIGFIVAIALVSVLVSAVNTANTMITSVLERTREIGTMKSVGAKNSEILKIFLFESAFLGFVAGIIGVLIGFAISFTTGQILKNLGWGFLQPAFPWYLFVGAIAFATLTGALSGIWPAWRASKLKAVDALRYE
ncbi:MAG: FtsX-like permease family protein [Nanoarchaeota archaeon]